jgi:Tfp pilus assembly PilM family ATPase/Tfp pilus assembly protein PilN
MYVTLNIAATSIRLLAVKGRRVEKWGSVPLAPGLVKDGLILDPKAVGATIDALFKSTEVPKKRVITSLTGLSFTYRILSLPRMKPALLEEAIVRGTRKEIPLPLEELYLSWQAIGDRGDELDFFVLGVSRNLADALVQTLAEAGVKPYLMDLKPLALARAANREDALIVALEPDCFDIVLVANGIPAIMHTITPKGEGASIEDNIRRLTDELSKTVKFYNSSHPGNPFSPTTPLLLTGELSADATTSKLIQAEIEYPVELLVPPLESPPDLSVAVYATNMGLALKKVSQKTATRFRDINLNILSGKYRARARRVPLRYILLPLALIIAIAPLFPMYQLKSQADAETMRLQTELSRVGQELRHARLASDEAKQIEDTINEIVADAETLIQEHRDILAKGGDFANNLELVTDALPSDAYFTSIEIDTEQITVEGEADSSFTVVSYAMALEAQGRLSEVRIGEIDESKSTEGETTEAGSNGVSFTIVISK